MMPAKEAPEKESPRALARAARRAVIKLGTAVLTGPDGGLAKETFGQLAAQVSALRKEGREVTIVTSGAVAAGLKLLNTGSKPGSLPQKQAAAAVGQSALMWLYERSLARYGLKVAQVLLTHEDLKDRKRYLNSRHTLLALLNFGIIPVVNENDTVAVEEIMLGDNDNLAAMVASLIDADLLVILSDIQGLYRQDPRLQPKAELIPLVEVIEPELERLVGGSLSPTAVGGMVTKIQAARSAARAGIATVIAHGHIPDIILKIMAGEEVGTLFLPEGDPLTKRKHWIAFVLRPKGAIGVDEGAVAAVLKKGKSLLASGIASVSGKFGVGDAVEIMDSGGQVFARGLTNYSSQELGKIKGLKSAAIEAELGYKYFDEVVHRDNLVVL